MAETGGVRDRIVGFRRIKASDLLRNAKNWRAHPEGQKSALRAMFDDIGLVGVGIGRETPEGVVLIDGHLRADELGDQDMPVVVTDLTEAEADRALLTFDPIGGMAAIDPARLAELAGTWELEAPDNAELRRLVSDLFDEIGEEEAAAAATGSEHEVKGMALQPHEHYDYLVVLATTSQEWNVLCEKLGLVAMRRRKRMGTCRAVRAGALLKLLR